jgi:hypothetical protein
MKYAKWLTIVFVVWFMIAQPAKAADAVKQMGDKLSTAVQSLSTFIKDLP